MCGDIFIAVIFYNTYFCKYLIRWRQNRDAGKYCIVRTTSTQLTSTSLATWLSFWQKLHRLEKEKRKFAVSVLPLHRGDAPNNRYTRTFQAIFSRWSVCFVSAAAASKLNNSEALQSGTAEAAHPFTSRWVYGALFTRVFCLSLKCCARPIVHCLVFSRRRQSTLIEFLYASRADKMLTLACSARCVIDILDEVFFPCSAVHAGGGLRVFVSPERERLERLLDLFCALS